jgi:hypothetical protein
MAPVGPFDCSGPPPSLHEHYTRFVSRSDTSISSEAIRFLTAANRCNYAETNNANLLTGMRDQDAYKSRKLLVIEVDADGINVPPDHRRPTGRLVGS